MSEIVSEFIHFDHTLAQIVNRISEAETSDELVSQENPDQNGLNGSFVYVNNLRVSNSLRDSFFV
jgi:hypothetical protein